MREEPYQDRKLGPLDAVTFFIVAVFLSNEMGPLFRAAGLARLAPIMSEPGYAQVVVLPLAYAFYPRVFTQRFWHLPRATWKWLIWLAAFEAVGLALGYRGAPMSGRVTIGMVLLGPFLEEIARAVLISP